MGSSYNQLTIKAATRKEAETKFAMLQDQDRYENGHSYSGGIGMARGLAFASETFATKEAAEEWLVDNAEKWGPAIAVRSGDTPNAWIVGAWCSS